MSKTFKEMEKMYEEVVKRFNKIDLENAFIEAREDEDRYLKSRGV